MFDPQNALERSLVTAVSDPAARPQFYRDLLESDLLIIDEGPMPERTEQRVLETGHTLRVLPIERNGVDYLPVFSSLPRLQAFIQSEVGYLAMKARDLMEVTRGANLVLNPGSEYGKELLANEIQSILNGAIFHSLESYSVQETTQVMLGQPSDYPTELVDALRRVFARDTMVKKAYLAHFFNPARDEKAHTLIAVDAAGEYQRIFGEAALAAENVPVPDPPVDFIQLPGSSLESYFREIEPFYRRKVLGFF